MIARCLRSGWIALVISAGLLNFSAAANLIQYSRAAEPLVKSVFLPLPPGAIEPAGWVRDWAVAAGKGSTGHLDEYHPTYGDAWKGIPVKAPNAAPDGTGWPLEQCAWVTFCMIKR